MLCDVNVVVAVVECRESWRDDSEEKVLCAKVIREKLNERQEGHPAGSRDDLLLVR